VLIAFRFRVAYSSFFPTEIKQKPGTDYGKVRDKAVKFAKTNCFWLVFF